MRRILVDASVLITLSEIGKLGLLDRPNTEVTLLQTIGGEVVEDPASSRLEEAIDAGWIRRRTVTPGGSTPPELYQAAEHLGRDEPHEITGDVALLAEAIRSEDTVVAVTDDKPLRKACKALGVPLSGSIGVIIAAVERGDLDPDAAKDALLAMDEVGARLSARLVRKAEKLIDQAAERREE